MQDGIGVILLYIDIYLSNKKLYIRNWEGRRYSFLHFYAGTVISLIVYRLIILLIVAKCTINYIFFPNNLNYYRKILMCNLWYNILLSKPDGRVE